MGRPLTEAEALQAVRRGQSVAQMLRYQRAADGMPATFTYVYVAPTPRFGIKARAVTLEDVGDGNSADMSWFPEVNEWDPHFDATGNLINGPDPAERSFQTAEEAFEAMHAEVGASDAQWRSESLLGDEYLAARRAAQ